MSEDNKKIFISYRRKASQFFALAVFQHLSHNGYDVFYDIESVGPGEFERIILNQITARAHFLAILAPGSLKKLENPDDWLRKEIEYALEHERNVIPVTHGRFDFDKHGDKLTGKLEQLTKLQALRVPDDYFFAGMDKLTTRYLQQPFYGEIVETPAEDEPVVERKIVEAKEEDKPTEADLSAEEYFNKGLEANLTDDSIKFFSLAIEKKGDYSEAYVGRGARYAQLENYNLAFRDMNKSIQLNKNNPLSYLGRGAVFSEQGKFKHAIKDYNKSIELDPRNAMAYFARGLVYNKFKHYKRAIVDYDKAIELDPQNGNIYNSRAVTYCLHGNYEQALTDVDNALTLKPDYARATSTKAEIYHDMANFREAVKWYDKALALDENVPHANTWREQALAKEPREPKE